ncbi:morphogenic membrane protein MmpA [Streptomyces sp. FR-108]|uniref:morphogenic membrane protein MmpA n=1 Tax=Streptomyces sp. FR-108 TaxID=3416665 RepID=UPI003CF39AA0
MIDRLGRMTTRRAPEPAAGPATQSAERAVLAGLALAILAGTAWTAAMIYTLITGPF